MTSKAELLASNKNKKMAVYKIFSESDTTLYSKFPAMNTGLDEILEVSVKNSEDPNNSLVAGVGPISADDLRRGLIKFSNKDLDILKSYTTGSWKSYLKLYLANAENLNDNYLLEVRQVAQSWEMGTGHFADYPQTRNGACWYTSQSYFQNSTNWINPVYYLTPGGGSYTVNYVTQSFSHNDSKDLNVDVTNLVKDWFSGSQANNGFLIKHPIDVENNSGSYIAVSFYSNDTHTVYPPSLDIRWDDSNYVTGSLSLLSDSNSVITLANNKGTYSKDTAKYRFRINARDKYPQRVFTTSSLYTSNKRLPATSYWSLIDAKTYETFVEFDEQYTKISCDENGNYFDVYMKGLEPERYYKILLKCNLPSGEIVEYDNNLMFKVIN